MADTYSRQEVFQVEVTVGSVEIPLWASIPPVIFFGGLAVWVRREAVDERRLIQLSQPVTLTSEYEARLSSRGAMLALDWSVVHITGSVITKAEALKMCGAPRETGETTESLGA